MATRIERRHYHTLEDWRTIYSERYDEGPITHKWLVDSKLCETDVAARKQAERHVKAGILYRKGIWPQTYGLLRKESQPNNVTLATIAPDQSLTENMGGVSVPNLNVDSGQITLSPPNNEP